MKYIKYTQLKEYTKLEYIKNSFLQSALLPSETQRKNNNHRFRRSKQQSQAEA